MLAACTRSSHTHCIRLERAALRHFTCTVHGFGQADRALRVPMLIRVDHDRGMCLALGVQAIGYAMPVNRQLIGSIWLLLLFST